VDNIKMSFKELMPEGIDWIKPSSGSGFCVCVYEISGSMQGSGPLLYANWLNQMMPWASSSDVYFENWYNIIKFLFVLLLSKYLV
jgi:hypothetical protein